MPADTVQAMLMTASRRPLEMRRVAAPSVRDGGAVPETVASEVCGTDSGRGADLLIEASGNPAAVPEGLEMLRDAGRYVVVGHYTDSGDATLNPTGRSIQHTTILGCRGHEFSHLHRALAMMARRDARFRWRELVTREYPLERADEALAGMERLAVVKALIRPRR